MTWRSGCGAGGSSSPALWSWSSPSVCWRAVGRRAGRGCRRRAGDRCAGGAAVAALAARWARPRRGCGGHGTARWSTRARQRVRGGRHAWCRSPGAPIGEVFVCACSAAFRSPSWRLAASSWPRVCACARSGCNATRATARWPASSLVRRDPFERRARAAVAQGRRGGAVAVGADAGRGRRARRAGGDRAGGAQRADRRRAGRRQVGGAVDLDRDGGAGSGRADLAAGRQARRAGGVGAGRRAARGPRRRRGDRAAAARARGDGRALPRAARARAAQGRTRGRAAAAPGGVRRAGVLPHAARQAAAPGVRRAAARSRRARPRGRRDRVRRDAEAGQRRGADRAARPVRLPLGAQVQHAAGVGHDPRAGLGDRGRGRLDDPGRAARRRLPARRGRAPAAHQGLLPRRRRRRSDRRARRRPARRRLACDRGTGGEGVQP